MRYFSESQNDAVLFFFKKNWKKKKKESKQKMAEPPHFHIKNAERKLIKKKKIGSYYLT